MPFDGSDFRAEPERPSRAPAREKIWAAVIIALVFLMLVMPVSAEGVVDIVRYFRGN